MQMFPEIETERLLLRRIRLQDIPALVRHANNQKISRHILNMRYPYNEPDAVFRIAYAHQGFKSKTRYVFAMILKETDELVGEVSLHLQSPENSAQLGYWIGETLWNKGLTTEAAEAIIDFGMKTLGLDCIYAECTLDNEASEKVMIKCKMIKNGVSGFVIQYKLNKAEFAGTSLI